MNPLTIIELAIKIENEVTILLESREIEFHELIHDAENYMDALINNVEPQVTSVFRSLIESLQENDVKNKLKKN